MKGKFKMSIQVIVGLQLGDCGKGRVTDIYAEKADLVVRVQGGGNAGHTIVVGDKTFKLHHIPSGAIRETPVLLGAGMVINPLVLCDELDLLEENGIDTSQIYIDGSAHINFPFLYSYLDSEQENGREISIGTTKKGIGPAYSNKHARTGIRFWDMISYSDGLRENYNEFYMKLYNVYKKNNINSDELYGMLEQDALALCDAYEKIVDKIIDGRQLIRKYLDNNKRVLVEGAQGFYLDIDYGQYPFVTSSCTTATGACLGTGIGVQEINEVVGVAKAYSTYVGNGAYPAEANENDGIILREKGHEYGTTTGRPRRTGWIDIPMLKDSVICNSVDKIVLTKLDILSGFEKIKVDKINLGFLLFMD